MSLSGKDVILTVRNTTEFFLKEKHKSKKDGSVTDKKERAVNMDISLISNEVHNMKQNDSYPSIHDLEDKMHLKEWILPSLHMLLNDLIKCEEKKLLIGHAITSACKPKLISPLLFALGVELDHCFGSKWLISHLSKMGYCTTYDEVRKYKQELLERETLIPQIPPGSLFN